jgi:N-acetylmuramoyl-L-alanine amidase
MAKIKICLDAGHAGKENRSPVVPEFYESDFNWKLHLKLKKELEAYGIQVITTRASQDEDLGTKSRGRKAGGCNALISIHSNSADRESADYPLAIVPVNGSGDALGRKLIDCIRDVMDTNEPADMWDKKTDSGADWYGVINGASQVGVPGIILEHSFYTNKRMAEWMMVDENLQKLANAEAAVIAAHYGVKKPTKTTYTLTAIRTFENNAEADEWREELRAKGWAVSMAEKTEDILVVNAPVQKPAEPPKPSLDEIAKAVINGDFGNGHINRETNLRRAGLLQHYTYQQIRKRVNELLGG